MAFSRFQAPPLAVPPSYVLSCPIWTPLFMLRPLCSLASLKGSNAEHKPPLPYICSTILNSRVTI
eukprot:scaffold117091_cov15-Prasinocladus_malaysianus.AAC.1